MKEINTYLCFNGNCREAMTFYQKCLGAELQLVPFSQAPHKFPDHEKDRIMHARLTKGAAVLLASDTMPDTPVQEGNNFWVCLQCESAQEVDTFFNAISEKGKVTMPLDKTFWAARFGMLTDQFGINWMFNFEGPKPG